MYVSSDLNRSFDHNYRSSIIFKTKSKQSLLSFRYLSGFQKLSKSSIMQLLLGIFGEWIKLCLDLMGLQNSFSMLFDPTKQTTLVLIKVSEVILTMVKQTTLILYILIIANVVINRRENIIYLDRSNRISLRWADRFSSRRSRRLWTRVRTSPDISLEGDSRTQNQNLGQ